MANTTYPANGSRTAEACAQREARWRDVLGRWKQSGLSKVEFSRQEGISGSVLSWWRGEIRRRDRAQRRPRVRRKSATSKTGAGRASFIPVRVVERAPKPVEVLVAGQIIRVLPDFDPETFRRIVQVLEGWPTLAEVQERRKC